MSLLDDLANAEREHPTFVYLMAFVGALNGLLFGFDTGVISGALPFVKQTFQLSTFFQEIVTSGVLVGAMVGAATGGRLADRIGRRPLLLVSVGGMTVMLGALGLGFYLPGLTGVVGYFTLGSMILYVAFFAVGLGPVFWLMISELYPQSIRGTAEGVATFFNWAANLLVALTFLSLIQRFGEAPSFWTLGVFSLIAFVFIYSRVPETMGRSLEDIESDLRDNAIMGPDTDADSAD